MAAAVVQDSRADLCKHLKVQGHNCDGKLGDVELVRQVLLTLIELAGMRPLSEPVVFDVPLQLEKLGQEPFEDEGGITVQGFGFHVRNSLLVGHATLSTSHIAIHTWPLRSAFHLDIYSCRMFEKPPVIARLRSSLGGHLTVHDLTRYCEE